MLESQKEAAIENAKLVAQGKPADAEHLVRGDDNSVWTARSPAAGDAEAVHAKKMRCN